MGAFSGHRMARLMVDEVQAAQEEKLLQRTTICSGHYRLYLPKKATRILTVSIFFLMISRNLIQSELHTDCT